MSNYQIKRLFCSIKFCYHMISRDQSHEMHEAMMHEAMKLPHDLWRHIGGASAHEQ